MLVVSGVEAAESYLKQERGVGGGFRGWGASRLSVSDAVISLG